MLFHAHCKAFILFIREICANKSLFYINLEQICYYYKTERKKTRNNLNV